jgi:hypothetical protein
MESIFKRQSTPLLTKRPIALTEAFLEAGPKRRQWASFTERERLPGTGSLLEVLSELAAFLMPPTRAASQGDRFTAT